MTWIELAGFITGIVGVYLTMKEKVWCFPIGLANVIFSLFLFYEQRLYADALQQIVYIVLLSYGWYHWMHGDTGNKKILISRSSWNLFGGCLIAGVLFTILLGTLLQTYTDAAFPWIDSSATSASFIAQYLVARKKLENWLMWIVVNITYISIYLFKDLNLYALLFSVYLILSFWGFAQWKKQLKANESHN